MSNTMTWAGTITAAAAVQTTYLGTVQTGPSYLGIAAGVLLAAAAGSLFGLAHTKPEAWRRLTEIPEGSRTKRIAWLCLRSGGLAFTLSSNAVASGWAVAVAPHLPALHWLGEVPPMPLAGILAYGAQRLIPAVLGWAITKMGGKP